MPSGDIIAVVERIVLPDTNGAQWTEIVGGSTPPERWPALAFDGSAIEYADLFCKLSEKYGGGGLDVELIGCESSGTSTGTARMEAAIRRQESNATHQLTDAHTYAYQAVEVNGNGIAYSSINHAIALTSGAQMDNLSTSFPYFVLRLRRNATHANDDLAVDWNILSVAIKEA